MKKLIILIIGSVFTLNSYSQNSKSPLLDSTSNILNWVSYYWSRDSLGQNGYRLCTYELLLKAHLDSVKSVEILEKLGKPNQIRKFSTGFFYVYYYFNGRVIPLNAGYSNELLFLAFKFEFNNPYLKYVYNGHDD